MSTPLSRAKGFLWGAFSLLVLAFWLWTIPTTADFLVHFTKGLLLFGALMLVVMGIHAARVPSQDERQELELHRGQAG
ncbi:hypothetical protein [Rothia halotolerans]|uniref:hypothetical protein n=1 Tax=Rothia halotolerans TaxID=405770 RepID=UPI00101BD2EF|nr:hypothetical protein [Rothia halotolerans]